MRTITKGDDSDDDPEHISPEFYQGANSESSSLDEENNMMIPSIVSPALSNDSYYESSSSRCRTRGRGRSVSRGRGRGRAISLGDETQRTHMATLIYL
ncbi:unnamed protein product [Euphydryas editha]|uniref:Uncharacterized protein n=1 Tax=Euphydryas editha TaxID=104508 RepID=A0AAU9TJP3_EUPED|nr:unnamed protein product [Euphydryas editha]